MSDDLQNTALPGSGPTPFENPYRSFQGSVHVETTDAARVVLFTGLDEPGLLHAAADWLTEHPGIPLLDITWTADYLTSDGSAPSAEPAHRLILTLTPQVPPEPTTP